MRHGLALVALLASCGGGYSKYGRSYYAPASPRQAEDREMPEVAAQAAEPQQRYEGGEAVEAPPAPPSPAAGPSDAGGAAAGAKAAPGKSAADATTSVDTSSDYRLRRQQQQPPKEPGARPPGPQPAESMVVYLGYLKLRVHRLLEAANAITALTEKSGGYVQSLGSRVIVVRIPASDFDRVMDGFAALGEVLDRRVKALDMSEQFTDLGARLSIGREARDRLLRLLETVRDVQERLRILHEVKRLGEEIESIESTLATLRNLAAHYTVTIELAPVLEDTGSAQHRSPFAWVRALAAHMVTITEGKGEAALRLPKGFVLFEKDDVYRAQAADTTTLRLGTVDNEPVGDDAYWADAVRFEMDGRDEETVEEGRAGSIAFRVFRNKDVRPRYYLVGVHVHGENVHVAEVFFPTEEAWQLHRAGVIESLRSLRVGE